MKKVSFLAAALLASGAYAQEVGSFEKWSVYGNFNHVAASTKLSYASGEIDGLGNSDTSLSLGLSKGFPYGDKGIVLVGGETTIGSSNLAAGSGWPFGNFSAKQKSGQTLYVAPGIKVTPDSLVYFKLGYEKIKAEASGTITGSQSFTGTSYGVGTQINLDQKIFMTVEFRQATYGDQKPETLTWKPKATIGTVGLGYRF